MNEEDKTSLERQRVQLIHHINIRDGLLLANLRARGALSPHQEEEIKGERDMSRRTGRLLDMLLRGDCDTMDKFVHSLRASNQCHIADKLLRAPRHLDNWGPSIAAIETTGYPSANVLSNTDRDILETARPQMMTEMDLTDGKLFEQLRNRHVLTKAEQDRIKSEEGNTKQMGFLVNCILRKTQNTFEDFLHALKQTGHLRTVEQHLRLPKTTDPYPAAGDSIHGGLSSATQDLTDVLRDNLADKLKEWKTAIEEGVSEQGGILAYVDQPCTLKEKNLDYSSAVELVEGTRSGDRIMVFGEAGMGKTTLLKHLANAWVEKTNQTLTQKFEFVFLLPMRLVWKGSLLGLICEEIKLIPVSKMNDLKMSLCRNESKTLFLLDSYEELRKDVRRADRTEIDDLIAGRLFQKSTVIVTSRPGSKLPERNPVLLKDLPAERVKVIIRRLYSENELTADKVLESFPAMSFLQKPINLALFLFVISQKEHSNISHTQAELLNMVMQYMMLAFAKKNKLPQFSPQSSMYVLNRNIHRDIRRLFRDIAKRCYEERKENNVMLHVEDDDDLAEYLEFGLFTGGPENNTLLLPHPLFQEFLAAAHLAETPKAWDTLFKEIKKKSDSARDRPILIDLLRPLGLENVVRFLVVLSPEVCEQIGSLFVINRSSIYPSRSYGLVNFQYYENLLHDCNDEGGKRVLANALVKAPVTDVGDGILFPDYHRVTSSELPSILNHDQRVAFLRTVHNIHLSIEGGKATLSCSSDGHKLGIGDTFVVALLHVHDSVIKTDELYVTSLEIPARMLSRDTPGLLELTLSQCTLCEGIPDYFMSDFQMLSPAPVSCDVNSSLNRISFFEVYGLEHCDTITSRACQLDMRCCGDVTVNSLRTCFRRVSVLKLGPDTSVVYETEEELISWLSTVDKVISLCLAIQHQEEPQSLCHVVSLFADREELPTLQLSNYTLLLGNIPSGTKQASTLSELRLRRCKGEIDLRRVLDVCCHFLQSGKLSVWQCELRSSAEDIADAGIKHEHSPSELELFRCEGDIDLVQVLEVCNEFKQLETLSMLHTDIREISARDMLQQYTTLSALKLMSCQRVLDLNNLLGVCSRCPKLRKLTVLFCKLIYDKTRSASLRNWQDYRNYQC